MALRFSATPTTLRGWLAICSVVVLTAAAFGLRISYYKNTSMGNPVRNDAAQYMNYASNIVRHGVFSAADPATSRPRPDSYRSPGYPLLIAAILASVDESRVLRALLLAQGLMSALLVVITYRLGRHFLPPIPGFAAAFLVAISPHLVSSSSYLLTETTFAFVLSLAILATVGFVERPRVFGGFLSGTLFGLAYLVNEVTLLLPFFLLSIFVWVWWRRGELERGRTVRERFKAPVVALMLSFSVFPICWSIRNHLSARDSLHTGGQRALNTLTHGTYPGFIFKDPEYRYYPYSEDPEQPEYSESLSNFVRIFSRRFSERPFRYLAWYLVEKPYYLWSWSILQGQGDIYIYPVSYSLYTKSEAADSTRLAMRWLHPFLVALVLLGSVRLLILTTACGPIQELLLRPIVPFLVLLYFTLLYSVFFPLPRYSVALRPLLYSCAVWVAWDLFLLWQRRKNRGSSSRPQS